MTDSNNFFSEIRDKITDGNLKEALTKLNSWSTEVESYLSDEIAQLLARYSSNERSNNLGNISNADYEIEKNKITKAGLVLLDEAKHPEIIQKKVARPSSYNKSETISNVENPALAFVKKNMLWIGLGLMAALILFFVLRGSSDVVQDTTTPTYETKQADPSNDNTKQQDPPAKDEYKKE